jgi:hypothetical protein
MGYSSWRGNAGMIMPTMRPGAPEEVVRLLPDGVGVITLYLDIKRGDEAEFHDVLPHYGRDIRRLARGGCEVIHPAGAPPFMLLGYEGERRRIGKTDMARNSSPQARTMSRRSARSACAGSWAPAIRRCRTADRALAWWTSP